MCVNRCARLIGAARNHAQRRRRARDKPATINIEIALGAGMI
jgi:hypothetical protein